MYGPTNNKNSNVLPIVTIHAMPHEPSG